MQRWLSFDQLTALHDDLTAKLTKGEIDLPTYNDEWDNLVSFSGWDQESFLAQVDLQWDAQKKATSPVFRS
jgi:hypothetical protein